MLFLTYSSFIGYYISFLHHRIIRAKYDSARRREEATCGVGGKDDGQADGSLVRSAEDGEDVSLHAGP
jgi:hypothetical protein